MRPAPSVMSSPLRRAWWLVALAMLATAVVTVEPARPAPAGEEPPQGGGGDDTSGPSTGPPRPIRWAALGDSYSSGEGLGDSSGDCQQSDGAYAPLTVDMLEQAGWETEQLDFRACTAAHASPSANDEATTRYLADQLTQLEGEYDLITLTIGGNDAGFGEVMRTCVLPDPQHLTDLGCWRQVREWNVYRELHLNDDRVRVTLDHHAVLGLLGIEAYEAAGLDPQAAAAREAWELYVGEIVCYPTVDGRISESSGEHCNDAAEVEAFDLSHDEYVDRLMDAFERQLLAHMDLEGLATKLAEQYGPDSDLLNRYLSPGGHVVVLGYPRLFEDPSRWPPMQSELGICEEISDEFVRVLRRAADELNATIERATQANDAVSFLPVADHFEGHNVCSRDFFDWINGITIGERAEPPFFRFEASFHPTGRGYEEMAKLLTRHVQRLNWSNLSGATALVGRHDGVDVVPIGEASTPLTFGVRPVDRSASEILDEVLGQPAQGDRVPPWPAGDDDEPPVIGGEPESSSGPPECWDDAYGMSVWRVGEEPYFAALYARAATTVGDQPVEAGALLGYRAFGTSRMVSFNDGVSVGATVGQLRNRYKGTDGRQVFDVQPGAEGPRGLSYVLAPVDVVDILDAQDIVLGPELGVATGLDDSDTIVERGAGIDGLQCGLDLVPEVFDQGEPGGGGGGGTGGGSGECARIGIALDASPSIVDAGAERQVRDAATGVVDALADSGAEVRISAFAGFPVSLTSGWVPLADEEGHRLARQVVGAMAFEGQGTNWEAALMDMAGQDADVVVLVTDGNPNEYGVGITSSPSPDGTNDFDPVALAAGVSAASFLRDQGARVIAVGAGDVRADSLAQVAGPTEGEDYYVGDFSDLGPSLAEVVSDLCGDG